MHARHGALWRNTLVRQKARISGAPALPGRGEKGGVVDTCCGVFRREAVMRIIPISQEECVAMLQRVSIGRLACSLNDQPYVVPVAFSYEPGHLHFFSTFGQKIEWMRQNPKLCLQADEIGNR